MVGGHKVGIWTGLSGVKQRVGVASKWRQHATTIAACQRVKLLEE